MTDSDNYEPTHFVWVRDGQLVRKSDGKPVTN